jgi:hypothetical protein
MAQPLKVREMAYIESAAQTQSLKERGPIRMRRAMLEHYLIKP